MCPHYIYIYIYNFIWRMKISLKDSMMVLLSVLIKSVIMEQKSTLKLTIEEGILFHEVTK